MTFGTAAELRSHYANIHARLLSTWRKPEITLIWWRPKVQEIDISFVNGFRAPLSLHRIVGHILLEYDVTLEELQSGSTRKKLVRARQAAFYALLKTQYSFAYIGKLFNRTHGTVISGAEQHRKLHGLPYQRAKMVRTGRNTYARDNGRFGSSV